MEEKKEQGNVIRDADFRLTSCHLRGKQTHIISILLQYSINEKRPEKEIEEEKQRASFSCMTMESFLFCLSRKRTKTWKNPRSKTLLFFCLTVCLHLFIKFIFVRDKFVENENRTLNTFGNIRNKEYVKNKIIKYLVENFFSFFHI